MRARDELLAAIDREQALIGRLRRCVQEGEIPRLATEPLIPPGLGKLTAPLRAFADFMRIDGDLLAVASEGNAEPASPERLDRWVAALPAETKSDLLARFAAGDSQAARAELLRRLRNGANPSPGAAPRTAAQLLAAAKRQTAERQRREAERAAAERVRRERAEAAAREEYLVRLAKREAQTWRHVETLVATRKQSDYDQAVRLLKDLKDLAAQKGRAAEARVRIHSLRDEHSGKVTCVERLRKASLFPTRLPADSHANATLKHRER